MRRHGQRKLTSSPKIFCYEFELKVGQSLAEIERYTKTGSPDTKPKVEPESHSDRGVKLPKIVKEVFGRADSLERIL